MNIKPAAPIVTSLPEAPKQKEKILFETRALLWPTIINLENLTLIGITFVIMLLSVVFHFGPWEFLIVAVLYLLLAFPSFYNIFRAGSTTYVLTNQRLLIFEVRIKQKEKSVPLEQILETKVKQTGLQRITGAGDVIVYQKALRKPVKLIGLKNCKQRADEITAAVKKYSGKS